MEASKLFNLVATGAACGTVQALHTVHMCMIQGGRCMSYLRCDML